MVKIFLTRKFSLTFFDIICEHPPQTYVTHRGALLSSRALAFYGIDLATFAFCRVTKS